MKKMSSVHCAVAGQAAAFEPLKLAILWVRKTLYIEQYSNAWTSDWNIEKEKKRNRKQSVFKTCCSFSYFPAIRYIGYSPWTRISLNGPAENVHRGELYYSRLYSRSDLQLISKSALRTGCQLDQLNLFGGLRKSQNQRLLTTCTSSTLYHYH